MSVQNLVECPIFILAEGSWFSIIYFPINLMDLSGAFVTSWRTEDLPEPIEPTIMTA
jgi:hypothetical protein